MEQKETLDFLEVALDEKYNIASEVDKCGYELVNVMRLSNHKDDYYLYNVMAYNENAMEGYQYACWIYNGRGLDSGIYHSTFKAAMYTMTERLNDVEHNQLYSKIQKQIDQEDLNPIDDIVNNKFTIVRTVNGLPQKISLTGDEIVKFRDIEEIHHGYNSIDFYEYEHADDDAKTRLAIDLIKNNKSRLVEIWNDYEDTVFNDTGYIENETCERYIEELIESDDFKEEFDVELAIIDNYGESEFNNNMLNYMLYCDLKNNYDDRVGTVDHKELAEEIIESHFNFLFSAHECSGSAKSYDELKDLVNRIYDYDLDYVLEDLISDIGTLQYGEVEEKQNLEILRGLHAPQENDVEFEIIHNDLSDVVKDAETRSKSTGYTFEFLSDDLEH